MSTESTVGTRCYKIAERLIAKGIAIVPAYPGDNRSFFDESTTQATRRMSTVDIWMNQGYPLRKGLHVVTPDHNWVCIARADGVGCLDIDVPEKCKALGMPALPEGVFTTDTPGKGLHIPFVHTDETRALGNVRNVFEDPTIKKSPIFEFKGHNQPWCGPWQQRADGGVYKPRDGQAPLLVGLPADLIAWIAEHSKAPSAEFVPTKWEFASDETLPDFLEHNKSSQDKEYTENGSLWVVVEECPLCGKTSGGSTGKAGKTKFIFSGQGYGFVCHACGVSGREEFEEAMESLDPDWEPWDDELYDDKIESTDAFPIEDAENGPEPASPKPQELSAEAEAAKLWAEGRAFLNEIRKGQEIVDTEKGKKVVKQARHLTDAAVFAYVMQMLVNRMKVKLFTDAYPYLFLPLENAIYDLHKDDAMYRILSRFDFLEEQKDYKLVAKNLFQHTLYHGEQTRIEKFGCMRGDAIYVNNGRNGMFKITQDGFAEVTNGTDGVYMKNSHLSPWPALTPMTMLRIAQIAEELGPYGGKVTDSKLCRYLNALFDEGSLKGPQYQQLVTLRYLSLFFGNALDLRPIMMAIGPQNSGKSTLWEKIMWLFYGVKHESSGLPTNLRSFISAVTNHAIQIFDNIDRADFNNAKSEQVQYIDPMCKCSTGGRLSIAELYKNNVDKDYQLRCDIFLTSRTNPFPSQYTDLLRRIQIFPIRRPTAEEYRTTESMKRDLVAMEEDLKLETLVRLHLVLKALTANRDKEWAPISEMHSYETYTMRVADYEGWFAEMQDIWRGYYAEYQKQATEDSPFVNFIRYWLGREGNVGRWARSGQIYKDLENRYGKKFTQFCRSDAAFGRRLKENYSALSVLNPDKRFRDGGHEYCFNPTEEQKKQCQNAYEDSLTAYARAEDIADDVTKDPSLAWD